MAEGEKYTVDVLNSGLEVWLSIYDSEGITLDDIKGKLEAQGIVYGIKDDLINKLVTDNFPVGQYIIAEGTQPINGEDSKVECLVEMAKPLTAENIGSKYFHIKITNVRKGQRLLRIIPATEGTPGYNVFGEEKLHANGKTLASPRGANTGYLEEEPNYLVALKAGNFVYDPTQVRVESEYKIVGDLSTVNGKDVECYGDLIVQGDVKVGVTLKVDGNLTITGSVEDANIECAGNIDIKSGIRGSGLCKITAYGDVAFFHGNNYNITTRASVKVGKIAMNCNITAKYIDSPRAALCGGKLIAYTYIEVLDLGKEEFKRTTIELAGKVIKLRINGEIDKEIDELSDKVKLCKDKVAHFKRVTANKTLSREQDEGIYTFSHPLDLLSEILEKRIKEKGRLQDDMRKMAPKVIVNGFVYDNVRLTINNVNIQNLDKARNVTYYEKDGEIITVRNN